MVIDRIENAAMYESLSGNLAKGLNYLRAFTDDPEKIAGFKEEIVEIQGKDIFAIHQIYQSEPDKIRHFKDRTYESHEAYIGIQAVLEGEEVIRVCQKNNLDPRSEYNQDTDVVLYDDHEGNEILLNTGEFTIFFPQDGHLPKMAHGDGMQVKKILIKVKADS